jgi:hypothetical protein
MPANMQMKTNIQTNNTLSASVACDASFAALSFFLASISLRKSDFPSSSEASPALSPFCRVKVERVGRVLCVKGGQEHCV